MPATIEKNKTTASFLTPYFVKRQKGKEITSLDIQEQYAELEKQDQKPGFFSRMTPAGSAAWGSFLFGGVLAALGKKGFGALLALSSFVGSIVIRCLRVSLKSKDTENKKDSKPAIKTRNEQTEIPTPVLEANNREVKTSAPILKARKDKDDCVDYDQIYKDWVTERNALAYPEEEEEDIPEVPDTVQETEDNIYEVTLNDSSFEKVIVDGLNNKEDCIPELNNDLTEFDEELVISRKDKYRLYIRALIDSVGKGDESARESLIKADHDMARNTILEYVENEMVAEGNIGLLVTLLDVLAHKPNEKILGQLHLTRYHITYDHLTQIMNVNDFKKIPFAVALPYHLTPEKFDGEINDEHLTFLKALTNTIKTMEEKLGYSKPTQKDPAQNIPPPKKTFRFGSLVKRGLALVGLGNK